MTSKSLDPQTLSIIEKIDKGKNLLLTGPAGTGKSTIVKALKAHYRRSLVITSTTGISALNIGGGTIHSFSGIGIHTERKALPTIMKQFNWSRTKSRIRFYDIVVIDEVSMMRSDQLDLIDQVFRTATGKDIPFGGKTMVFVGDFLQLPPVTKRNEPLEWIFSSKVWKDANIESVHLYTIHRQNDPEFLKHLLCLRFGWCTEETDQFFKNRIVDEKEIDPSTPRFFSTNIEAENFNTFNLEALESSLKTHKARIVADNEYYEKQIKSSTLAQEILELKIGARVMFLNNNKSKDSDDFIWVNGSLGTVVGYEFNNPIVKLDLDGNEVEVEPFTWKLEDWNGVELASFRQIPLKLSYGVTIHKSQGLTLDKAVIDCRRIFANGQAYVAVSRVRSSDGLFLLNWRSDLVRADDEAVNFYLNSMEEVPS